jgi:hypothetical protein
MASMRTYISACTVRALRTSSGDMVSGNGGGGDLMRHASRAAATRNTVMPIHLCHA